MKQALKKASHTLYTVLCTVVYKIKLWNIRADYAQLDMDMMCTTMTYKEYCEEQKLLDYRYDALTNGAYRKSKRFFNCVLNNVVL